MRFFNQNRLAGVVVAIASLVASGCVPTTWLPDSSGFVFVKANEAKDPKGESTIQLVHFDIKKNAPRVIADKVESNTFWPAVSPDGNHIAVARFAKGDKGDWTAQIVMIVVINDQGEPVSKIEVDGK